MVGVRKRLGGAGVSVTLTPLEQLAAGVVLTIEAIDRIGETSTVTVDGYTWQYTITGRDELDIGNLSPGKYTVQLEIGVDTYTFTDAVTIAPGVWEFADSALGRVEHEWGRGR